MKTLAAAIARQNSGEDGLRALYLPDQLTDLARGIVRSANTLRPKEVPFSILVSDVLKEDLVDVLCPVVGMGRSIQYRRDDRLAVVCSAHSVPASFSSSFGTSLESGYPGERGVSRSNLFEELATAALDILLAEVGADRSFVDTPKAINRLASVFGVLAESYERLAQGGDSWNVFWLRHLGAGLDAMVLALGHKTQPPAPMTADALLAEVTFASFGLPRPATGIAYGHGRRVEEALMEFWSTAEGIALTLQRLRHHPTRPLDEQGTSHALEKLSFANFGQTVATKDNVLLAWGTPDADVVGWVGAYTHLNESEFFSPQQGMDSSLRVFAAGNAELEIAGEGTAHIVVFAWEADAKSLRSEPLRVVLPTSHIPDSEAVLRSQVTLRLTGTGASNAFWVGKLVVEAAQLIAEGSIVIPRTGVLKMPAKPLALSTSVPGGDSLASCAGSAVSSGIYPVVEGTVGVWTFEGKGAKGTYKPGSYRGYETIPAALEDAGVEVPVESNVGTAVRCVAWGSVPSAGFPLAPIRDDQQDLIMSMTNPDLVTTSEDELSVGSLVIRWRAGTSTDEFLSPLVAAARGGAVSAGEPDMDIQQSFRGRIETFLARSIDDAATLESHGHFALFEDIGDPLDEFEGAAEGAVLVPRGRQSLLKSQIGFRVSDALRSSPEASRFREAIARLDISKTLGHGHGSERQANFAWPSRSSWAWAFNSDALDEYLTAYTCLIERASAGTPQDFYWASFPFSVSVYATGGAKRARAVLLSPLHPLRLAWLASAETALRQSPAAERLAGVLEAWNLPIVGPQADSHNGRVVAVPMDAGPGQLFLGWSMLVSASVAGHDSLDAPAQIGAVPAPGTSVTGLNADAVRAALRTFHRMNPQVSTLSIDLASSTSSPRLEEIDQAVVEAIALSGRESELRGGIRVHDSLNRVGEPPLADLERRLGVSPTTPVRWSRYDHNLTGGPQANIRFLQDAGVKVEVSSTDVSGAGRIAAVPLRRFSTPGESAPGYVALEFPGVNTCAGSTNFVRALAAVERSEKGIQISAELFKAALVNDTADWTVTGESLVGASALADMLAADGSGQMLWEWRPPFLEKHATPQLDARPFVSVVRLPEAVKNQIKAHVTKASGSASDTDRKVRDVMNTLGTRGIGLSSLMAQGGTHAAGAVGFYLALKLLEKAVVKGSQLLVLPIDACDEFLRGLANETTSANQLRRADLLLVAVEPDGVTLVPVEIKCYGLGVANFPATLPSSTSAFSEALTQLGSTADLLKQVVDSYQGLTAAEPTESALWRHGFATMIEAAMRLRPAPSSGGDLLGLTLDGLLSGEVDVRLGRSMLLYFGHEGATTDGSKHALHLGLEAPTNSVNPSAGALVCNTQVAFDFVGAKTDSIGRDWQQLVEWVLLRTPAVSQGRDETSPPVTPAATDAEQQPASEAGDATRAAEREVTAAPNDSGDLSKPTEEAQVEANSTLDQLRSIRADGVRFEIGKVLDGLGSHSVDFWPSNTALNQMNVGVVGDLGTGKTQFLKSVVFQLRNGAAQNQPTPISMLIFDYKRDYHDAEFLRSVGGVLQRPFHIPLNVLAIDGDYTPQKAVQAGGAFVDIITKIYGGIGPVQKSKVLMIIKRLFAENEGAAPTLGEILEAYLDENTFDSVAAVLNGFVLNEVFSEDHAELLTMDQMLEDKVLVLAVSDLGADENLKTALITLFLNKYYEYMLRMNKWPFEGEAPNQMRRLNSFVLVDEATNIMAYEFPVLSQLLLQSREFGVGVILASQYVSHFKVGKTNYGETLLTKVVHKVPSTSVNELKAFGFASANLEMVGKVPNLAVHQALVKTLGIDARFMRGTPYFELSLEPS